MANPQKENGYTPIANELLEQIYGSKFNATQLKIILFIMRYTYGFSRKEHKISLTFISKGTNISKRYITSELNKLIELCVVNVIQDHTTKTSRILSLNKDYEQWGCRTILPQVNNTSTGEQSIDTPVEQYINAPVEELFHQDKQNIKQNIKQKGDNIYIEIFDYYQTLNLIAHRTYTQAMATAIKKAMGECKYDTAYCKTLLDRHKLVVERTKDKGKYAVQARTLHQFFGQKVKNAQHLICSEYEEGGDKYERYIANYEKPDKELTIKEVADF